jgi:hypothetical protein
MSYKKRKKRVMHGKTRPEQYDSEEDALEVVKELQKKSSYKFIVQHSVVHRDKWVIIEYLWSVESTE